MSKMLLEDNIEIEELFLKLDKKLLVLSDIHMGYEEALNKQGILIPRSQYPMTAEKLKKFLTARYDTIVINGDIKHEFGTISETEWRHTLRIIDYLASRCRRLVLVRGNHDKTLGPIADKRNIEVVKNFVQDNVLITHGDHVPEEAYQNHISTIIIGHEHPAVSIMDYPRVEKFKCFLGGRWKGRRLLVMPSLNLVHEGTDVLRERLLSPFLQKIDDFEVYVVGDEVLYFGTVRQLKRINRRN